MFTSLEVWEQVSRWVGMWNVYKIICISSQLKVIFEGFAKRLKQTEPV